MTKKQTIEEIISALPSPYLEICRDVLLPNNAIVLKGFDIRIRVSEIEQLPPNMKELHFAVNKKPEIVTQKKGRDNAGKKKLYSASSVPCITHFEGMGAFDGYYVHVEGKTVQPHELPITHQHFGQIQPENAEYLRWSIGEGVCEVNEEHIYSVVPQDAKQYIFLLFSHLDKNSPIFKRAMNGVAANIGILSRKDKTIEAVLPREAKRAAAEAYLKIDQMSASQAEMLKIACVANLGFACENLRRATTKETKVLELQALTDKYGVQILKLIEAMGDVEIPTEDVAKALLADGIKMKVLEIDKEGGLLIAPSYEDRFKGVAKEVKIGEGAGMRKRLQFFEPVKPSFVVAYMTENMDSPQVTILDGLVDGMRGSFNEADVAKGGDPSWNSLLAANGIFRKK